MSVETAIDDAAAQLDQRLGGPDRLIFPEGWTTSTSWHRAQACEAHVGPASPVEFDVLLGRLDGDGLGDRHRVIFAIYDGEVVADCDCDGHRFRGWCAHVALLWWRWSRERLGVVDVDTGRTHLSPPWWVDVGGGER